MALPTANTCFWAFFAIFSAALMAAAAPPPKEVTYLYNIPVAKKLKLLPGWKLLNPTQDVHSVDIAVAPVTYKLQLPGQKQVALQFTTPGYVDKAMNGKATAFSSTLRVSRGDVLRIKLTNMMIDWAADAKSASSLDTNLHAHGVHANMGITTVDSLGHYNGEDQVLYRVKARANLTDPPQVFNYNLTVPEIHMPGHAWYHPHIYQTVTMQAGTMHGLIIINDDHDVFLPDAACKPVRDALESAEQVNLDLTLLFFKSVVNASDPANANAMTNNPSYQWTSSPGYVGLTQNPYCCDAVSPNGHVFGGTYTEGNGQNLFLLNGGFQPILEMPANTWQRWRVLYSGAKGFTTLSITNSAQTLATQSGACDIMLVAKDGLYLMDIPRRVDSTLLGSGNRLEMLVRCRGAVGDAFVLSAGYAAASPFSSDNFAGNPYYQAQEVVGTIKIVAAKATKPELVADLTPEACTPKRTFYNVDMRDEALTAAGYNTGDMHVQDVQFTRPANGVSCGVNGQSFTLADASPFLFPLGKIVQWTFNDARFHPMHNHVNAFQIVAILPNNLASANNRYTNFFQVGDFYDTFVCPVSGVKVGAFTFRFQPGPFSGLSVAHCHYLQHEDTGCMKLTIYQCPGYADVLHPGPDSGKCTTFTPPIPGTALPGIL